MSAGLVIDPINPALVEVSNGYVAGEETAIVDHLNGGPGKPTFVPPRPYERGVRGRPTLIYNVETLASLALISRYGGHWYREVGTAEDPGSTLITITGAVASPGVYEIAGGTPLVTLLNAAGGPTAPLQAFLVGGYAGSWFAARRRSKSSAPRTCEPPCRRSEHGAGCDRRLAEGGVWGD